MLRDITLGQYYPADLPIHRLDPRVKLSATLIFIVTLFAFGSVSSYVVATVFLAAIIKMAKIPLKYIVRGLKPIFMLMLLTVVFNLFLTDGTPVLQMWESDDYAGRNPGGSVYGRASHVPDYRVFADDADDYAE